MAEFNSLWNNWNFDFDNYFVSDFHKTEELIFWKKKKKSTEFKCSKCGNNKPEIFPHEDFDHQFVRDYYDGISKKEAENRIDEMLKNVK